MKKQIEEMATIICQNTEFDTMWGECYQSAEALYNAGYRKASAVAREFSKEIEEGVKAAISALQFENNPIHRKVKHETYSSLMRFIKSIEGKYLGEDNNVPPGYMRFEAKAIPATLNVKYTEGEHDF